MDLYKRKVSYSDIVGRTQNLTVTASTLYFPFFLTQNIFDIGLYSDTENPVYEVVDFSRVWNFTGNTEVVRNCTVTNSCNVSFTTTPITTYGATNGSIVTTINGCVPQTISWVGPNGYTAGNLSTISNLRAGTYTMKIIDSNCNISYATYVLTQPQPLSFTLSTTNSQTNATIGCNGSATINPQGGLSPYTYAWFQGSTNLGITTNTATSLCAGYYTAQVTDSNNVIVSQYFNITQPSAVSGTVTTTTNIDCFGGNTGSISLSVSGGINYPNGYTIILTGPVNQTLNGITSNATLQNLTYGNYSIQVLDSVGNSTTLSVSITQPVVLNVNVTHTNVGCYDSEDGSLNISVSGGTPPYDVTIKLDNVLYENVDNITSGIVRDNLDVGAYTIEVSDTAGCTSTVTKVIQQKPRFNLSQAFINSQNGYEISCFGGSTGVTFSTSYTSDSTTYSVTNNNVKYYVNGTYNPPAVLSNATKTLTLSAGTYTITAVDSYLPECSATTIVILRQPPTPLTVNYGLVVAEDNAVGCAGCGFGGAGDCRQIVLDINGGVGPYSVVWDDGTTADRIVSTPHCLGSGYVNVIITDDNNCSQTLSIYI